MIDVIISILAIPLEMYATTSDVIILSPQSYFGSGSGNIWLDEVECTGRERELDECAHPDYGNVVHCTGHDREAGVACTGNIRLSEKRKD